MCRWRHPLPDYYTVALEVSRGRTTRARTETCLTDDAQPCFDGVDVGDKFIRRELNEPCDRLVSWSFARCAHKTRLILQRGIAAPIAERGPGGHIVRLPIRRRKKNLNEKLTPLNTWVVMCHSVVMCQLLSSPVARTGQHIIVPTHLPRDQNSKHYCKLSNRNIR